MEIQTKLDWEKFRPLFGNWHEKIAPFFFKGGFDPIFEYLKDKSRKGFKIAPLSEDLFRVFQETDVNNVYCWIFGMSPYHSMIKGTIVADGLLMGCSKTGIIQPSLEQFYNAAERELYNGLNLSYEKTPDVSYLSKQGIFMGNVSYSCEIQKAGSHIQLWSDFNEWFMSNIVATSNQPVIFLGKDAGKSAKYLSPFQWNFVVSHPASASYKNTEWDSEGVFGKVNKILKDNNNYQISWLKEYKTQKEDTSCPF